MCLYISLHNQTHNYDWLDFANSFCFKGVVHTAVHGIWVSGYAAFLGNGEDQPCFSQMSGITN